MKAVQKVEQKHLDESLVAGRTISHIPLPLRDSRGAQVKTPSTRLT